MKNNNISLDERMKQFYENVPKTRLMKKEPVIVRCDGRAFHTFTKHFSRPFDEVFIKSMQDTTKYLCENIPGCVLGYVESDEISLVLTDYEDYNTAAWYDYEVQKLTSVIASMTTMIFNKAFEKNATEWKISQYQSLCNQRDELITSGQTYNYKTLQKERNEIIEKDAIYKKAIETGAMFDARVFNLPKEEVANYILWRQQDASRNSVQMLGHAYFSQSEMQGKNNSEIQDMLMLQKGINWNNLPTEQKRGSCVIKNDTNGHWFIDREIPIFKGNDREYIESRVYFGMFTRSQEVVKYEY